VTIRGDRAHDILERGLKVKEMELKKKNFSESGIIYIMYIFRKFRIRNLGTH